MFLLFLQSLGDTTVILSDKPFYSYVSTFSGAYKHTESKAHETVRLMEDDRSVLH